MTTDGSAPRLLDRAAVRIALFAVALAVVFGALFCLGRALGPWDVDDDPGHGPAHTTHQPTAPARPGAHQESVP